MDLDAFRDEGLDETAAANAVMDELNATMESLQLSMDMGNNREERDEIENLFSREYPTAKVSLV